MSRAERVVVDASVAVKQLIPEDYSDEAYMLLRDHLYVEWWQLLQATCC